MWVGKQYWAGRVMHMEGYFYGSEALQILRFEPSPYPTDLVSLAAPFGNWVVVVVEVLQSCT